MTLRRTTAVDAPSLPETTHRHKASPVTRPHPPRAIRLPGSVPEPPRPGRSLAAAVLRPTQHCRHGWQGLRIRQQVMDPGRTDCRCLPSLITTVEIETETSSGICASSPRNEISRELTISTYDGKGTLTTLDASSTRLRLQPCKDTEDNDQRTVALLTDWIIQ